MLSWCCSIFGSLRPPVTGSNVESCCFRPLISDVVALLVPLTRADLSDAGRSATEFSRCLFPRAEEEIAGNRSLCVAAALERSCYGDARRLRAAVLCSGSGLHSQLPLTHAMKHQGGSIAHGALASTSASPFTCRSLNCLAHLMSPL